jgi:hypothetical protein
VTQLYRYMRNAILRLRSQRASSILSKKFARSAASIPGAGAFSRLHRHSLAVSSVRVARGVEGSVNVVLPELHETAIFAGIRTAIEFSTALATAQSRGLRLLSLSNEPRPDQRARLVAFVRAEFDFAGPIEIAGADGLVGLAVGDRDLWVATHWTTAHSIDVAVRLNVLDVGDIIYLIQDYEPGFYPWSSDYALARSTYRAGFRAVVNSTPLYRYLRQTEGIAFDERYVFGPSVDLKGARRAYELRTTGEKVRILFYGRPSKPRNLFDIGVAALALAASDLEKLGIDASFISVGEGHESISLTPNKVLRSRGKLSWDAYFDLLGSSDLLLSLQHSPHPSHPPLDAVTSGAFAVTNEMGATRANLHDRYLVAESEPRALADQILVAVQRTLSESMAKYDGHFPALFGKSMGSVAVAVSSDLVAAERSRVISHAERPSAES